MKTLTLILFVLTLFVNANAQSSQPLPYDSLVQRVLRLEARQDLVQTNLNRGHRQFRTGTAMMVVGVLLTGLSYAVSEKGSVGSNQALAIAGGTLIGLGGIIQIDSHRFTGKAGGFTRKKRDTSVPWQNKTK